MIDKNAWSRYIDATCNGDLNTAIAAKVGVDNATVGRWRTGATDPKPRQVVAYARAYGQSPLSALIEAGFLTADEAGLPVTSPAAVQLDAFATLDLAKEVVSRLEDLAVSEAPLSLDAARRNSRGFALSTDEIDDLNRNGRAAAVSDEEMGTDEQF